MSSILPVTYVELELAGPGGGWTDVSADVESAFGLDLQHGTPGDSVTDRVASTGTAKFVLDNVKNAAGLLGRYSPFHANVRTGFTVGIGCRIRFQDPNTSTFYLKFIGRIDVIDVLPGVDFARYVSVTAVDWMDEAARWNLTPAIGPQVGQRDDQILTAILAEMPRQPAALSFALGIETYPFALDSSSNTKQPALSEFQKLMMSGFGRLYLNAEGTLIYENRHSRILKAVASTVWDVPEAALIDLQLPFARDQVLNHARVTVHQKRVDAYPTTIVFRADAPIFVPVGEVVTVLGTYRSPFTTETFGAIDVQQPVNGVDFTANANETGDGVDKTGYFAIFVVAGASGVSIEISNVSGLGNVDGGAWVFNLQLLGRAVYDRGDVVVEDLDASSIADVGERIIDVDMPYQGNVEVARAAAQWIIEHYVSGTDPFPTSFAVLVDTPAILDAVLNLFVGDYIALSETVSGLNSVAFVNHIQYTVDKDGYLRAVFTIGTHTGAVGFGTQWILGISELSVDTILAYF